MQPQTFPEPIATPPAGSQSKKRHFILFAIVGIILAVLLVVILVFFVFKPQGSPGPQSAQAAITIAHKPYLYACSMFTRDDITATFNTSKDKFFVSIADALSVNGKPVEVLQLTGKDNYGSSCTYHFDLASLSKEGIASSKKVDIYAVQYKDTATAQKTYEKYKAEASAKPLPSFKTGYAFNEQDKDTGKKFVSASVLHDNLEVIVTTTTDFGFTEDQQITKIDTLLKRAFARINDGKAATRPDFNGIVSIKDKPASDVCANLDIASLGKELKNIEFRRTDVFGVQNTTQITESSERFPALESICTYYFRTAEDSRDPTNEALSYDDRYVHFLSVTKRVFADKKEAAEMLKNTKRRLQTPSVDNASRGDYAELNIADGGARVISVAEEDTRNNYYILQGNNYYRIEVVSNTRPTKSFTSKGIKIDDSFIEKVFEQASR